MADSNMLYAYFWACRLPQETLPTSIKDVEVRAILIDKIDFLITGEGNTANTLLEYMSEDERQVRLGNLYCNSCKIKFQLIGISANNSPTYCPCCGKESIERVNLIFG